MPKLHAARKQRRFSVTLPAPVMTVITQRQARYDRSMRSVLRATTITAPHSFVRKRFVVRLSGHATVTWDVPVRTQGDITAVVPSWPRVAGHMAVPVMVREYLSEEVLPRMTQELLCRVQAMVVAAVAPPWLMSLLVPALMEHHAWRGELEEHASVWQPCRGFRDTFKDHWRTKDREATQCVLTPHRPVAVGDEEEVVCETGEAAVRTLAGWGVAGQVLPLALCRKGGPSAGGLF